MSSSALDGLSHAYKVLDSKRVHLYSICLGSMFTIKADSENRSFMSGNFPEVGIARGGSTGGIGTAGCLWCRTGIKLVMDHA